VGAKCHPSARNTPLPIAQEGHRVPNAQEGHSAKTASLQWQDDDGDVYVGKLR